MSNFLGTAAIIIVLWSVRNWLVHGLRVVRNREPWLPWEPRRAVPWGAIDIVLTVILLLVLANFVMGGIGWVYPDSKTLKPADFSAGLQMSLIAGESLIKVLAAAGAVVLISLRLRAAAGDWGWQPTKLWDDFKLGLIAFTMIVPPVYMVQGLIVLGGKWESKHPLIEMLKKTPGGELYLVSFIAAVIVAPLVEEWAFRVLLQGWLEKLFSGVHSLESLLVGDQVASEPSAALLVPTPTQENPYGELSPAEGTEAPVVAKFAEPKPLSETSAQSERERWQAWLPIGVSASLFAAAHVSHGPDFIALFLLSLGQGYLYQRTHRILPVIVVHLLLNLFSMLAVAAALVS